MVGGPLFDIFGPRWILISGTILAVFGVMMTSVCTKYYEFFLAQGIISHCRWAFLSVGALLWQLINEQGSRQLVCP